MKDIYKVCHKCKENKKIEEFVKVPHQRVGVRALCSVCYTDNAGWTNGKSSVS